MTYVERSDAQLIDLARQGGASAFGVLVHRYGPPILRLAEHDEDPVGATVATFVRAMRRLEDADDHDVAGWLMSLAATELDLPPDEAIAAVDAAPPRLSPESSSHDTVAITELIDPRLDEVWAELSPRWPNGRLPRHVPSWVIWVGTILVLMALAVLLPWAVLGSLGNEPVIEELRASPVLEDVVVEDEPIAENDEEPLPSFEFPQPPDEVAETDPQPATDPDPQPEQIPAPDEGDEISDVDPAEDDPPGDEPGEGDGSDDTDDPDDGDDAADSDDDPDAGDDDAAEAESSAAPEGDDT